MSVNLQIKDIYAREILDSRGNPTVETEVQVEKEGHLFTGRASVPSGASTGSHEARELRDGDRTRYQGKGVTCAVTHVNTELKKVLLGENALNQLKIDYILRTTDGSSHKERLGANALLSVSMACAKAAAKALNMPLFRYLGGVYGVRMPIPMMNILNGGRHAHNTIDFQEFMILPVGAVDDHGTFVFREGLRWCTEVYHALEKILRDDGLSTAVGDEGGFAPDLKDTEQVFEYLMRAVRAAGYEPGSEIAFAVDAAASELHNPDSGLYYFPGESACRAQQIRQKKASQPDTIATQVVRSGMELIQYYEMLIQKYPIVSIEDGLEENDWEGWQEMTRRLGDRVQLVGDDLFVTDVKWVRQGIEKKAGNAVLIKVNQIGTLSEAMEAIVCAKQAGYRTIVSHRSGETQDTLIADLCVALNCGQIKAGAPCRGERTAKYNQLLRIEEEVGSIMKNYGEVCTDEREIFQTAGHESSKH